MNATTRAVVSSVATAAFAVTAFFSWGASLAIMAVLVAIFAWGWPQLTGTPSTTGPRILLLAVAVASSASVLLSGDLRHLALVAALGVIGAFLSELARRDGRPRLVESLASSVTGVVIVCSAAGWAAIGDGALQIAVVLTAAGTLAAGAALAAVHMPPWPHALATIAVAIAVGIGAGVGLPEVGIVVGGIIGLASGLISASLHTLLGRFPSAGRPFAALAAAVLPLVVVGVPVYSVVRYYLV